MQQWYVMNKAADFKKIGAKYGIDQVTARVIRNRDIVEDEDIRLFLEGDLSDCYDPAMMKDGDRLTDILIEKINAGAAIRIVGDYDIDGVMSTYILKKCLERAGADVSYVLPDRVKDGYGLNVRLIDDAYNHGIDTIITCDNGIAAVAEIAHARELGMTVLVTDHHEIPDEKPQADAIVDPHQKDCAYPYKELCGAGVAWKTMCLLFRKMNIEGELLDELLENVAFATVGDIMTLDGENRILVKEGLKRIHHTKNIGMQALINQCGLLPEDIESYHFGYVLGPCINASGRLETATKALELLLEENPKKAEALAAQLCSLNEERKEMTQEGVDKAIEQYEKLGMDEDTVVVLYLPQVHESIAGIIAGRVREYCHKPVFILTQSTDAVKGSGRSIEEYSMYEEMCKVKDLFIKFGGHPMAAGLSLPEEKVDEFRRRINENSPLTEKDLVEKVKIDVPMPVSYVTRELVREFEILAPFGKGNPRPVFADRNLYISRMWCVGKNQNVLRLSLSSSDGRPISAIYFGNIELFMDYLREKYSSEDVELALRGKENRLVISVVYAPRINTFRDEENLQFEIQYYQ